MNLKKPITALLISVFSLHAAVFAEESLQNSKESPSTTIVESKTTLAEEMQKLEESGKSIREYEQIVASTREKADLLSAQLQNLDAQVALSQEGLLRTRVSIEKSRIDEKLLLERLSASDAELIAQQKAISDYVRMLWDEEQRFTSPISDDGSVLRLLLSDEETISEAMKPQNYLTIIEAMQRRMFHRVEISTTELKNQRLKLEAIQTRLSDLQKVQKEQLADISAQRDAKNRLLEETRGEQSRYETLLAQSRAQEAESSNAIASLRGKRGEIDEKLAELSFDPNDPYNIAAILGEESDKPLEWPVDPIRGLSAYFHDPRYDTVFHTQHNAIDIPTRQGTPILAPANGFVTTVRDNGYGYSYLVVAHAGDLATLYGHISRFAVRNGDFVRKGQIIGYSGGLPGSKGAGVRTTGPHLHFEVHKNEEITNPLSFLPMRAEVAATLPKLELDALLGKTEP